MVLPLRVLEVSAGMRRGRGVFDKLEWGKGYLQLEIAELKGADDPNSECVEQLESLVKTGWGQGRPHKGR